MNEPAGGESPFSAAKWYELFSRGARDWLRHDAKVRDAVRRHLPQLVAAGDLISGGARTVRVPVTLLEHHRFRLRRSAEQQSVGQGAAKPGDVFADPAHRPAPRRPTHRAGYRPFAGTPPSGRPATVSAPRSCPAAR